MDEVLLNGGQLKAKDAIEALEHGFVHRRRAARRAPCPGVRRSMIWFDEYVATSSLRWFRVSKRIVT